MEIIRKDMRACRVDKDMIRNKEQWRGMIQVVYQLTPFTWDNRKGKEENF